MTLHPLPELPTVRRSWRDPLPDHLAPAPAPGEYVAPLEPVAPCAECFYPLGEHDDGVCPTVRRLAFAEDTYRYLPGAADVVRDVADSWGERLYVFTPGGCYDPPTYTVRGDSWADAWEWFAEYAAERGLLAPVDDNETLAALEAGDDVEGASYVDGAGYYWADEIRGWEIAR